VRRALRKRIQGMASAEAGARRGQSLIELAFAMPLMLLILLGTIDLGRMFFDYIQLRSAVIDGAMYASRNPNDTSGAIAEAQMTGVPAGTVFSVTVSGNCGSTTSEGKVTVAATSTFRPVTTGFLSQFGLDVWTLRASSTMRCMT